MKAYILAVAGVILLSAVVTIVSPGGKTGKFVKGMMKLFTLLILVSPVLGLFRGGVSELFPTSSGLPEGDAGYYLQCSEQLERADEADIASYIMEKYGCGAEVSVEREDEPFFSRKKIEIIVNGEGINGEDERIHIVTCLREELGKLYGCEVTVS